MLLQHRACAPMKGVSGPGSDKGGRGSFEHTGDSQPPLGESLGPLILSVHFNWQISKARPSFESSAKDNFNKIFLDDTGVWIQGLMLARQVSIA
jgi:hypothetical protein